MKLTIPGSPKIGKAPMIGVPKIKLTKLKKPKSLLPGKHSLFQPKAPKVNMMSSQMPSMFGGNAEPS